MVQSVDFQAQGNGKERIRHGYVWTDVIYFICGLRKEKTTKYLDGKEKGRGSQN